MLLYNLHQLYVREAAFFFACPATKGLPTLELNSHILLLFF